MENNTADQGVTGVILMTYGSATTADEVENYMHHIYHGAPPDGLVDDFKERYRLVGHSPLIEITQKQATLTEDRLNREGKKEYIVRAGMLHSMPFISNAVQECKDAGATRCIGFILSPQFSSFIMDGYRNALVNAALESGFLEKNIVVAGPWPTEYNFIHLLGDRIRHSLKELEGLYHKKIPVVFTTHSLPKRVVEKDPHYLDQLRSTITAIVKYIGDPEMEWYAGYQSAGHTPEEWLKPDLTDILADIKEKDALAVLIAPIQFLADHLEILYDLDIAGRKQCEDIGIVYNRISLPNDDPLFISSICYTIRSL